MATQTLPRMTTGARARRACPAVRPDAWQGLRLRFNHQPCLRVTTRSVRYVTIDEDLVFARTLRRIKSEDALDPGNAFLLSRDLSECQAEHLFAVRRDVFGEGTIELTGAFTARVFEDPYRQVRSWVRAMEVASLAAGRPKRRIFTLRPFCADCGRIYTGRHVVGLVEI